MMDFFGSLFVCYYISMAYSIILFDIDGTLCDPGRSLIESARYALAELGVEENDEAALRRFVGPPLEHSFRDYYGFDDAKTKQACMIFRDKLQKDGIKLYTAYPGIAELLQNLHDAGKTTEIVTSKMENIARAALDSTGIISYFDIIGAQQPGEIIKKEVILSRVLKQLNISDKTKVVMIGDRMHDIEAANTHGIDSIGVLWGYGSIEEFKDEGATYTVENTSELRALLLK